MTRGKMILAALACALIPLAVLGAGKPDIGLNRGTEVGLSSALGDRGVAKVDTFRVWSRDATFPNYSAKQAGYITALDTVGATINGGTVGTSVRWGWMQKTAATSDSNTVQDPSPDYIITCRGGVGEDDAGVDSPAIFGMVWVSANGLTNGDKIERAKLIVNVSAFGGFTVPAGGYIACRLDTVSADYRILNNHLNGRFRASWTKVDNTGSLSWSPIMTARRDRHDFGPRSDNVIGPGTYAAATSFRFNVTDAVQQASDNGTLGRGLLFMIYGSSGVGSFTIAAGTSNYCGQQGDGGKGCPTFLATSSSRRGVQAWGGTRVPMALTFDDQYDVQSGYLGAMQAAGLKFDTAIYRNATASHAWVDSAYTLGASSWYFINHSRSHPSLGGLTAPRVIAQMSRSWYDSLFTGVVDTTLIVDAAWPGGGSTPARSLTASSMMKLLGYRSCRGYGTDWTATDIGMEHDTWLSWSGYVQPYQTHAILISTLMAAANPTDRLYDYIDEAYTDHAKAALIFYGHRNTGTPADGITAAKLTNIINIANASNNCRVMSYGDIMARRLGGATVLEPGAIMEFVSAGNYTQMMRGIGADSNKIQIVAARQDSVYEAAGDANLLQMWIGPK